MNLETEYKDLTRAQIVELQNSPIGALAAANLLVIFGIGNGVIELSEGLKQLHNISFAIMNIEADD